MCFDSTFSLCTSFSSDFLSLRTSNQVLAKKWLIKSSCFSFWSCSTVKTQESAIFSRLCCIGYTESFWDSEPSSESKSITFFSSKSHPHQQTFSFSSLRPYCTVVFQLKTYSLHNHFYAWGFIRDVFSQVSFEIREKMYRRPEFSIESGHFHECRNKNCLRSILLDEKILMQHSESVIL